MMLSALKRWAYPEGVACVLCGRNTDGDLCGACSAALDACRLPEPLCPVCGYPMDEGGICPFCAEGNRIWARNVWFHRREARELVHLLKYDGRRAAADVMARAMLPAAQSCFDANNTVISWVPMPESRFRDRYRDHARVLAESLAALLDTGAVSVLERVEDRKKPIRHQVGSTMLERRQNLKDTFRCCGDVSGRTVLLLDDVMTTGATADCCTECLMQHGAARVALLTATRAASAPKPGKNKEDINDV